MRFKEYITEFSKAKYGFGITFVDIDETLFRTFAKILVKDKETGKVLRELDNQEFNSYELKPDEEYDFGQFRNAKLFKETSIPIPKTVNRLKRMLRHIKADHSKSRVIFLTARSDFDNKQEFLQTFREYGIDVDLPNVYIERTGNIKTGTVDEKKKKVMMEYIKTGLYRRVRLIDDHKPNLQALIDIEKNLPSSVINKVEDKYNLDIDEKLPPISFYALWVQPDGSLRKVN